jgi:peroxiredoxin family protein
VETNKKTIILFSGDLDKVMAAFIIAIGAAAMDDEVTMFFTFWSISALRKDAHVKAGKKTPLQKMFSSMVPRGPKKLGLSKLNFGGMGPKLMMRSMRQQNVMTLTELIETAREEGIKFVACTMSMDVMGLQKEELIDGVEYAGVAAYLGEADESNVNLFI